MTAVTKFEVGQRVLWHPRDSPSFTPAGEVTKVDDTQVSLRLDNGTVVLTWRWNVTPC